MCGTVRRGWICKTIPQINSEMMSTAFGSETNFVIKAKDVMCFSCGKPRAIPDPSDGDGPVTEPLPEWACLEIFCGEIHEPEEDETT